MPTTDRPTGSASLPFPDKDTLVIAGTVREPVWSTLGEWEIVDGCKCKDQDHEPPMDTRSPEWRPLSVPIYATKDGDQKPLRYYPAQRLFVQLGRGGFIDTPARLTKLQKIPQLLEDNGVKN